MEIFRDVAATVTFAIPLINSSNRPYFHMTPSIGSTDFTITRYNNGYTTSAMATTPTAIGNTGFVLVTVTSTETNITNTNYPVMIKLHNNTTSPAWDDNAAILWLKPPKTNIQQWLSNTVTSDASNLPIVSTVGMASGVTLSSMATTLSLNYSALQTIAQGVNVSSWSGTAVSISGGFPVVNTVGIASAANLAIVSLSVGSISSAVVSGVPQPFTAQNGTLTTGTNISGSYADTKLINNTYWITAPVTPAVGGFGLNEQMGFSVSASRVSQVTITGRFAAGAARAVEVWAWNYSTLVWDLISSSTTRMNTSASDLNYSYTLLPQHQDTAGNAMMRFTSTSTTTGDRLNIDQILVNAVASGATANEIANAVYNKMAYTVYDGGVTIDTIAGFAGTDIGVMGIPTHPVNNITDALTLASSLGVKKFYFIPDSLVTLTQNHDSWTFVGKGLINLNGQSINDAIFRDSELVFGTSAGDDAYFINCVMGNVTLYTGLLHSCVLGGTITTVASQTYTIIDCVDGNPGATSPAIVFAPTVSCGLRDWRGGINLNSLAASNNVSVDGAGRVIFNSNCTGGTVRIRGEFELTDSVSGGFASVGTLLDTSRYNTSQAGILTSAYDAAKTAAQSTSLAAVSVTIGNIDTRTSAMATTLTAVQSLGSLSATTLSLVSVTVGNIDTRTTNIATTVTAVQASTSLTATTVSLIDTRTTNIATTLTAVQSLGSLSATTLSLVSTSASLLVTRTAAMATTITAIQVLDSLSAATLSATQALVSLTATTVTLGYSLNQTMSAAIVTISSGVNTTKWAGVTVSSAAGLPLVNTSGIGVASVSSNVNVVTWAGTTVSVASGLPLVNTAGIGVASISSNVNVVQWLGATVSADANHYPIVSTASGSGGGLSAQQVRDAMTLATTATIASGSLDDKVRKAGGFQPFLS